MDFLPLIFILWIGFLIFKNFVKSAGQSQFTDKGNNILTAIERAAKENAETGDWTYSETKTPPLNGRDRMALNARQISETKKIQKARKASHKSPAMHGRRGKNMDQNRHRTDEWGQRGDSGILNSKAFVILLVIGGVVLYALSQMPPR